MKCILNEEQIKYKRPCGVFEVRFDCILHNCTRFTCNCYKKQKYVIVEGIEL